MKFKQFVAAALLVALGWNAPASAEDMLVSAASSLTNGFAEVAVQFQQAHPGTKVLLSFAGSDTLMTHIANGMPSDVFASADQVAMDKAVKAGVVDAATSKDFIGNELVLIVPASKPGNIKSLSDLAGVERIALGNPAMVPAGRYAKAALEKAGAWNDVKQREVLGENARQVLDYVARGAVDAGIVFATDAATVADKVKVIQALPSPIPLRYSIAPVERENRHPLAAEFIAFVLSDQGQSILAKHGFAQP
ncbi:molybdate ABC transporter substrate-binding protein [Pollutimonas subterranea]|uniref:Molybdate ABC transporter substrate-binding protein n=1 Tax=Pollutimonas subterranea TaxID=2045210 RepID=A0A2N4U8T8_9BURK|nr:molybdate ABC transporter substrate-binding protein [Pollutimonas subterranea]PLC51430.1 molybdate ABC transporter substrate-binding protein [Pollutimonas subterranea]